MKKVFGVYSETADAMRKRRAVLASYRGMVQLPRDGNGATALIGALIGVAVYVLLIGG